MDLIYDVGVTRHKGMYDVLVTLPKENCKIKGMLLFLKDYQEQQVRLNLSPKCMYIKGIPGLNVSDLVRYLPLRQRGQYKVLKSEITEYSRCFKYKVSYK